MTPRHTHITVIVDLLRNLDAARLARAMSCLESHELLRVRLVLEEADKQRRDDLEMLAIDEVGGS